jgi:hypothetical protein
VVISCAARLSSVLPCVFPRLLARRSAHGTLARNRVRRASRGDLLLWPDRFMLLVSASRSCAVEFAVTCSAGPGLSRLGLG